MNINDTIYAFIVGIDYHDITGMTNFAPREQQVQEYTTGDMEALWA
jgi:hypothetical protein